MAPPHIEIDIESLPIDDSDRHEVLVDIFDKYLIWARDAVISGCKRFAESASNRSKLAALFREPYEHVAEIPEPQRNACYQFAQVNVDKFAKELLYLLSHRGLDFKLGSRYAARFNLEIEICDVKSGEVIIREPINTEGKSFFADYWSRWLNRNKEKSS
jgi:hypothetical protein